MRNGLLLILAFFTIGGGGCVERTLTIQSEPPGALVYMNGEEVGRTPMRRDFTWYGNYDVQLRREGYETLKTTTKVNAPIWQWVPFDLMAEILPLNFEDHQSFSYTLKPTGEEIVDPQSMLARAEQMETQLRSGRLTRPTTRPTTAATTQPVP